MRGANHKWSVNIRHPIFPQIIGFAAATPAGAVDMMVGQKSYTTAVPPQLRVPFADKRFGPVWRRSSSGSTSREWVMLHRPVPSKGPLTFMWMGAGTGTTSGLNFASASYATTGGVFLVPGLGERASATSVYRAVARDSAAATLTATGTIVHSPSRVDVCFARWNRPGTVELFVNGVLDGVSASSTADGFGAGQIPTNLHWEGGGTSNISWSMMVFFAVVLTNDMNSALSGNPFQLYEPAYRVFPVFSGVSTPATFKPFYAYGSNSVLGVGVNAA